MILFDLTGCQPFGKTKYHGGGLYGYTIFKTLVASYKDVVAYYDFGRFILPEIIDIIKKANISSIDARKYDLSNAYLKSKATYIYSPLYSPKYKKQIHRGDLFVITLHGLRDLEMNRDEYEIMYAQNIRELAKSILKKTIFYKIIQKKEYCQYRDILSNENVSIITVSNHSKYSISTFFPEISLDNIKVFYSPFEYGNSSVERTNKYYLIVSANRWIKNSYRTIKAMDMLFDEHPKIEGIVVVTGLRKESSIYNGIRNKDRFIFKGYVSSMELENLYANAYALLYLTLNEGFGYPPLEAARYGVPTIASPFSSIPEICGDSVIYANPYDEFEIINRVLQLNDCTCYDTYSKKAKSHFGEISLRQKSDLLDLIKYLIKKDV